MQRDLRVERLHHRAGHHVDGRRMAARNRRCPHGGGQPAMGPLSFRVAEIPRSLTRGTDDPRPIRVRDLSPPSGPRYVLLGRRRARGPLFVHTAMDLAGRKHGLALIAQVLCSSAYRTRISVCSIWRTGAVRERRRVSHHVRSSGANANGGLVPDATIVCPLFGSDPKDAKDAPRCLD